MAGGWSIKRQSADKLGEFAGSAAVRLRIIPCPDLARIELQVFAEGDPKPVCILLGIDEAIEASQRILDAVPEAEGRS